MIATFWDLSANRYLLMDSERLLQINKGFLAYLFQTVRVTFDLSESNFETLFKVSVPTIERRRREQKPLDPVASERLDRIFAICDLTSKVFESRGAAAEWYASGQVIYPTPQSPDMVST